MTINFRYLANKTTRGVELLDVVPDCHKKITITGIYGKSAGLPF